MKKYIFIGLTMFASSIYSTDVQAQSKATTSNPA